MNNTMNDAMIAALIESMSPLLTPADAVTEPPPVDVSGSGAEKKVNTNRCNCCSKKLVLSDFACGKCNIRYCGKHRLPESHQCKHDFRASGAEQLKQQLARVVADKIDHI